MDLALLDGTTVAARALGWDARDNDGTEWALFHSDLPVLARLIGTLTVNYVDELGYTQYVVHGVPVDPGSITPADYVNDVDVLTAAGTSAGAEKAWDSRGRGPEKYRIVARPKGTSQVDYDCQVCEHETLKHPVFLEGPNSVIACGTGCAANLLYGEKSATAQNKVRKEFDAAQYKADQDAQLNSERKSGYTEALAAFESGDDGHPQLQRARTTYFQFVRNDWGGKHLMTFPEFVKSIIASGELPPKDPDALTAAGTSEGAKKAWLSRDRGARAIVQGQPSKEEFKKYLANVQPGEVPPFPLGPGQKAAITKKFQQIDAQVAADQAEWEATMAKIAADNAEVAAEAAVVDAAVAQAQVDQFQYQQQLDLDAEPPPAEPVPADPSLVETTKSGKTQLTKEAFTDYLAVATADTIPPGPLGAGQKAAITKKLQAIVLQADVVEANAIDAAAQAKLAAESAAQTAQTAQAAVTENPDYVVKPIAEVLAQTQTQKPAEPAIDTSPPDKWYPGQSPGDSPPPGYVYEPTTGAYTKSVGVVSEVAPAVAVPSGPMSTPEFQAWIKTVQPGMVIDTPQQLLPWQKAALTKKLKAVEAPGASRPLDRRC